MCVCLSVCLSVFVCLFVSLCCVYLFNYSFFCLFTHPFLLWGLMLCVFCVPPAGRGFLKLEDFKRAFNLVAPRLPERTVLEAFREDHNVAMCVCVRVCMCVCVCVCVCVSVHGYISRVEYFTQFNSVQVYLNIQIINQ